MPNKKKRVGYVSPKRLSTPGMTDEPGVQSTLTAGFMNKEFAANYQRTATKLNYFALDNLPIAVASKEASRSMRSPRQGGEVQH